MFGWVAELACLSSVYELARALLRCECVYCYEETSAKISQFTEPLTIMSSLITNVLTGVGKQVWNSLTDGNTEVNASRASQLQEFQNRLDFAVSPEKASFKSFLQENFVSSLEGIEFLSQKLQDGMLSDPELAGFISRNGGLSADISIEENAGNFVLKGTQGEEWIVPANSELETTVSHLYHLESIRQLASVQPGLDIGQLVDLSFQKSATIAHQR